MENFIFYNEHDDLHVLYYIEYICCIYIFLGGGGVYIKLQAGTVDLGILLKALSLDADGNWAMGIDTLNYWAMVSTYVTIH